MPHRNIHHSFGVKGNALNILFSKILLGLLIVLPFSLFYGYFSETHSRSIFFNFSLAIQAIISACMGFAYLVSLVLAKQNFEIHSKNKSQQPSPFIQFLEDTYRSILPVSIQGNEKLCYSISFISYLLSSFVLSFEISIMAFTFFIISLSQLHLLLNSFYLLHLHKK